VIALTWRWTGYNAVILLSGLQNIPKDLYDAASVDGAGSVTRFFRITVPLLRPVLLFCTVLGTIGTLQLFTEPFILTGGGPNNATLTSFYYIYDTGFARFDFGLAAAGTYVLATIVAVISYAQIRLARWGEV
jgi:lactose/L-arabinose transport system permease protein